MNRKKILILLAVLAVIIAVGAVLCSCGGTSNNPEPTPTVDPFDDPTVTYDAHQWVAQELHFTSDKEYEKTVYTVDMDCIFTNTTTGTTYTVPAFWDGGTNWVVRYALTEKGDWTWKTTCTDDTNAGLNGQEGTLKCGAYKGDLAIYQHGFIKTEKGKHYFMYADGTPFFYIADTHFSLPLEDYDGYGDIPEETATQYNITSMFKYIMDYRADQGFTVIQSQQLGKYVGLTGNSWMGNSRGDVFTFGVNDLILEKFQTLDKYFLYISEKGLVHTHTQFAYPEELIEVSKKKLSDEQLEKLCRYWVARYSAYPVMWATAQEGDKDYYKYNNNTAETNRWKDVFVYIQKYDPYDHPATCHQEHYSFTRVNDSAFKDLDGYTFFAMQYSVNTGADSNQNFDALKEYWYSDKQIPAVNYEGKYDHFWTGERGARTQAWCAYLNGVFGQGYGVQPIWELYWAGNDTNETSSDGETYARDLNWFEGLTSSGGFSMSYMRKFFEEYEWWNMTPCFDGNDYYEAMGTNYSAATIGDKVFIAYYYGENTEGEVFGKFKNMPSGSYELKWYNPLTGEYTSTETKEITDGTYTITSKPSTQDYVFVAKFLG